MGFRPYVPDPEPAYAPVDQAGAFDTFGLPPGAPIAPSDVPITGKDLGISAGLGAGGVVSSGLALFGPDSTTDRYVPPEAAPASSGRFGSFQGPGYRPRVVGSPGLKTALDEGLDILREDYSPEFKADLEARAAETEASKDAPLLDRAGMFVRQSLGSPARAANTLAEGAGNVLPTMAGGRLLAGASKARNVAMGIGGVLGAGAIKSNIYDTTYDTLIKQGVPPEVARAAAETAQSYTENPALIATGAAAGVAAGRFGADEAMIGAVGGGIDDVARAASKGLLRSAAEGAGKEIITEGPQESLETYLGNVGAIGAGAEMDPRLGVLESGVKASIMAGLPGAGGEVVSGMRARRAGGGQASAAGAQPGDLAEDEFTQTASGDAPPATNWKPQAPGEVEARLGAPIAPSRPKPAFDPTAAQIVLEAEILGGDGLAALKAAGMSEKRARIELERVRAVLGPKAPPAKGVDRAEDKKAAQRRAQAEAEALPSPADAIASFDADPLANAPKPREGTPEELAAYMEDAQRGISTAEDESTLAGQMERARSEAQANLENQAYSSLLARPAAAPSRDVTAARSEAQRNLEEQWAREHADQLAVAEAGGPAFYVPKLIAEAKAQKSIKPLVDAGVPGSRSQLWKMLDRAKASVGRDERVSMPDQVSAATVPTAASPGIGLASSMGQLGEVGQEARAVAEGVNPVTRAEEAPVAVEAGPAVNRPGNVRPDEVRGEPNSRPRDDAGEGSEVHAESVRPIRSAEAQQVGADRRALMAALTSRLAGIEPLSESERAVLEQDLSTLAEQERQARDAAQGDALDRTRSRREASNSHRDASGRSQNRTERTVSAESSLSEDTRSRRNERSSSSGPGLQGGESSSIPASSRRDAQGNIAAGQGGPEAAFEEDSGSHPSNKSVSQKQPTTENANRETFPSLDEIMKPEINTQGVGPMNIMGKLADHPGYRGLVDQVRGKSTDEAVKILADAELKDWLIRPTIELAGGQAPTPKQVRAAVQEVSDRKQDEWFRSQNPDIVMAPHARGNAFVEGATIPGAEDRWSFLQRTAAERGNAPEITKEKIAANKTKGADLAAALRGESAPVEAPTEKKPEVRAEREPAVAPANEPARPEVSGTNRVTQQRPRPIGEEAPREGRNVGDVGGRPSDLVADEAPKAVEAHAESVPQGSTRIEPTERVATAIKEDFRRDAKQWAPVKHTDGAPTGWFQTSTTAAMNGNGNTYFYNPETSRVFKFENGDQRAAAHAHAFAIDNATKERKPTREVPYTAPKTKQPKPEIGGKTEAIERPASALTGKPQEAATVPVERPKPEPKPVQSELKAEPKPTGSPEREALIDRIVEAAAAGRPKLTIHEIFELKGTDGKWYGAGGMPQGVRMVEPTEKRSKGFGTQNEQGIGVGVIKPTREAQEQRVREMRESNDAEFRKALEAMPEERLKSQAEYWLKEKAPAPAPKPAPKGMDGLTREDRKAKDAPPKPPALPEAPVHPKSIEKLQKAIADVNVAGLRELLHPMNKRLRAMFTEATGIALPKGVKDTWEFLGNPQTRTDIFAKKTVSDRFFYQQTESGRLHELRVKIAGPKPSSTSNPGAFDTWSKRMNHLNTLGEQALEKELEKKDAARGGPPISADTTPENDAVTRILGVSHLVKFTPDDLKERIAGYTTKMEEADTNIDAGGQRLTQVTDRAERKKIEKRIGELRDEREVARKMMKRTKFALSVYEGDPAQKLIAMAGTFDAVDKKKMTEIVTEAVGATPAAKDLTKTERADVIKKLADGELSFSYYSQMADAGLQKTIDSAIKYVAVSRAETAARKKLDTMEGLEHQTGYKEQGKPGYLRDLKNASTVERIEEIVKEFEAANEVGLERKRFNDRKDAEDRESARQKAESLKAPIPAAIEKEIQSLTGGEFETLVKGTDPNSPKMALGFVDVKDSVLERLGKRGLVEPAAGGGWSMTLTATGQEITNATQRYDERRKFGLPISERIQPKKMSLTDVTYSDPELIVGKYKDRDFYSDGHFLVEGKMPEKRAGKPVRIKEGFNAPTLFDRTLNPKNGHGEPVRPVAFYEDQKQSRAPGNGEFVVFSNGFTVNGSYLDYVRSLHPNTEMLSAGPDSPLYFKAKDGRIVGVVMGIRGGSAPEGAMAHVPETLGDQVEEPLTKVEKPATEPKPESAKGKIGDFGEKIGGARKDVWSAFQDRMKEAEGADILTEPLSKVWPEPDYEAMLEGGADPWTVAFMHASRDEVPAKPRVSYRVASWAKQTKILRDMAFDLVSGKIDVADARKKLSEHPQLLDVQDRAELYQLVGHGKSLSGVRVRAGSYSLIDGVKYNPPKTFWTVEKKAAKTAFSNWPNELARAETREAAIKAFKEKYDSLQITPAANKTDFVVYTERKNAVPKFFVGKKLGRNIIQLGGPFETVKEARAYRNENQAALEAKLEEAKKIPPTRRETNEPRVGEDMRNGQDVTKQLFEDSFGFRGVEFGNWVGQKKRQADLNDAFDSLMDMAAIIGVPPKALSLNGELGLAFGARGGGGVGAAAAHYEPDKIVINITKEKGAGSIGHEWFHAVDNYFSRMRGERMGHVTESPAGAPGPVRQEMLTAFRNVMNTIRDTALKARSWQLDKKRSSPYWTTSHEMAARAYESYLISKLQDQNASNDYLANIVDEATWDAAASLGFEMDKSYPYPTAGEIPKIREAFDDFFKTVQTKETDKGVAMFDRKPSAPSFSRPTTPFFSQLERAAEQMKQPMRGAEALRFLSTREGVKAAELKWTGLDDFLQKRGGERVTPEDVKEFLKANKVTVTEVTKGYDRVDKAFDGWTDEDVVTHYGDVFGSAPEDGMTIEQMKREISNAEEEGMEGGTGAPSTPKFSQYQTPGGTNYREVLLTLPPKAEGAAGLTVDAIAKRLGYSGWHSSLTEDQKARVNAAFAAQPYGPGKGPEVEPGRGAFRSSHFDEPNILAHVRLNDRTVNGKKVLFVEEIQSDYGQMARRNGIFGRRWGLLDNSRVFEYVEGTRQEAEALAKKRSEEREALGLPSEVTVVQPKNGAVPDAPFIEKTEEWTALALKAILHKASTEGYDSVAFTTGDMQNARYDLAKQVDKIQAFHRKDGTFDLMVLKKGDRSYTDINKLTPSQLEDNIGKDLAAKIVEQPQEGATGAGWKTYEGLDLAVGGKGMRAFYDKIVPQVAEKIGKKWGAKVGTMNFRAGGEDPHSWKIVTRDARFRVLDSGGQLFPNEFDVKEQAEKFIRDAKAESALSGAPVHSIAITPEMRASVTSEGFPLFQRTDQTTEEAWQHYDSKDGEKTTLSPTAYRDGGRIVGAPPDVRVVDFMGDVDKSVLTDMAKSRASLAHYVASAERQIQRAVPGFKFGGFTPAGNLHGVNFQGRVFLNDLATHQIALEIVSAERITYPEAYARAMWDVILHESAHYAEKGHKGPFLAELDRIETEVGPQAIRAIKRDFMRYASEEKHRTQTQKMYEKALPGWREGERRGREAAARAETRSGGLRTRPDVATGFQPRPRGDTGDSEGVRGEGDEPQGSLFAPDGNQAEGLAAPAFVRGTDGRGVEPPAPAFERKPAAPAPTPEELKDPTFWEKATEWRKGAMLSSIRNLAQNAVGNVVSIGGSLAEIPFAAAADRVMNDGQRQVYAGELAASLAAFRQQGPEALARFRKGLSDSMRGIDNLDKEDAQKFERHRNAIGGGKNSGPIEKKIGTAIRTSFRIMGVTDEFFKDMAYQQALYREAYRQARNSGLQGAAAASRVDRTLDDFRESMGSDRHSAREAAREGSGSGTQRAMHAKSDYAARYRTFTLPADYDNAGAFGWIAKNAADFEKTVPVLGPTLGLAVPFKITPAHVAFQAYERTPLAAFSVAKRFSELSDLTRKLKQSPDEETTAALTAQVNKKTEEAVNTLARAAMGSVLGAAGFALAVAGLLTGSGPPDPDDRRVWQDAGHIPNAVRIGDSWYAFDKLDPVMNVLALAANLVQASKEKDANKLMGAYMNALQETFVNNTFLDSFQRFSDMMKDPARYGKAWLQQAEGSFVPSIVRQTAETIDPTVRNRKGIIAPIVSGIPGLSKSLPAVRTGTGEPAKRTQRLGESTLGPLSPFGFMRTGDAKGDPLAKEFMAADYAPDPHRDFLSIGVGPVGAKVQHRVPLTEKELEVFRNADEQTTKRLREIIKSDQWARLSAEQKKGYFQKVYASMGAKAKEAVMPGVVARLRSTLGARK